MPRMNSQVTWRGLERKIRINYLCEVFTWCITSVRVYDIKNVMLPLVDGIQSKKANSL